MSDSEKPDKPKRAAKAAKKTVAKAPKRSATGKDAPKKLKSTSKTTAKKPGSTVKANPETDPTAAKKKKRKRKIARKTAGAPGTIAGPVEGEQVVQASAVAAAQADPPIDIATEDAARKAKPPAPVTSMLQDEDDLMQPPPKEAQVGAPLWVVTFADLMSLLMCFFVMLLSMSSMEITTFKKMVESMKRGLGQSMSTEMEEFGVEQILSEAQILQAAAREQTRKQSAEMRQLLKQEINDGKIEVEEGDQQITIQILQAGSFAAGSATLKKSFVTISTKLKSSLDKIPGAITVAGHTDNQPMNTKQFRSNWELSSARAFSVIHSLLKKSDLKPDRFVLRGFAETRPRVPNDSPQNRGKNRRVEIIIDQRASSNITGTDNPDNLERIIINAETLDNYHRNHVRPINSAGSPPPAPVPVSPK